jgi:DNA polymerase-1
MSNPQRYRTGSGVIFASTPGDPVSLNNHWTESQEYEILRRLDAIFTNPSIPKVAQNAPFDIGFLAKQFGIIVKSLLMDTMVAWHTLYSELPKGLDFLASILTRIPYYSDHDNADDIQEWTYNCWDACATWEISHVIEEELRNNGLLEFYENHVQPTIFAVTRTSHRGVLIDEHRRAAKTSQVTAAMESSTRELQLETGNPEFNPNSSKQLADLLYNKLRLPVQLSFKRQPDGSRNPTADKNARDQLAKRFPEHAPLLRKIDTFSENETLLTGFLRRPTRADGRMYTHFNVAGTVGSRLTSSDPIVEPGTNLQNIPIRKTPDFRGLFIADAGWTWVKLDLKAAEYMVVVWAANIQRIIIRFISDPKFDPHRLSASQIYAIAEEMVTNEQRDYGKNGNYGGNYGMTAPKAAIVWKIMESAARFLLDRYHSTNPEIRRDYWGMIQQMIRTNRTIISPLGRRRMFFGRLEDNPYADIFRDAYNYYAQNIVGDVINRGLDLIDEIVPEEKCRCILQVHDEIDALVRHDSLNEVLPMMKKLVEYPIEFPGVPQPLVIPAELSYGPDWYYQTKWKGEIVHTLHRGELVHG